MHLVAASSTSAACGMASAGAARLAIALDRVEEEVPGKVARSASNEAASGTFNPFTPFLFYLASTLEATTSASSTPQLNCRQGLGGRRAGLPWVKVDVFVTLAFEWQLLQHVDRRRGSSGFNTRLVCRASFNRADPFFRSSLCLRFHDVKHVDKPRRLGPSRLCCNVAKSTHLPARQVGVASVRLNGNSVYLGMEPEGRRGLETLFWGIDSGSCPVVGCLD
ncbi:hypothetical protein NBRC10513_007762 [Rhodotorula toruloides]